MKRISLLIFTLGLSTPCFAQSGADVLLDQLGEKRADVNLVQPGGHKKTSDVDFDHAHPVGDIFQQQLAVRIQGQRRLGFDVKQWANFVLDGEYAKAAHLWTAIQPQVPEKLRLDAEATQVYLLWKLGLNQTFFDQWVKNLASPRYVDSDLELTLETLITPHLDQWLIDHAVVVSQKDQTILDRLPETKTFILSLKAWSALRREKQAAEILPVMTPDNRLTRFVAQTVVYSKVRENDLKGAAKILKEYVEPAIAATHDLDLLAKDDLSIARILYQAGQMKGAAAFYKKIPNTSTSYLASREELAWVYLRQGDMANLRGEVKALSSPVFKDRFQPEVYLLRAVSDLKMCFYDMLDQDLNDFSHSNAVWAKKIDQALNSKAPPAPSNPDEYTQMSERAEKNLVSEVAQLQELGHLSIGATLPAVGVQKHWKDYTNLGLAALEEAKKRERDEYNRQWKNQRSVMLEAIRKMRFVKVEYMSQVRQLSASGELDKSKMVASNTDSVPASQVVGQDADQLNFPANTEIWPDELFKLRSAAQAQCLKKAGTH